MRNFIVLIALVVLTLSGISFASKTPLPPAIAQKFNEVNKEKTLLVKYNVGSTVLPGHGVSLGDYLEPGTIITRSYIYLKEGAVSASENTLSFGCEASGDIMAAKNVDPLATNSIIEGASTGASSSMVYIGSRCQVSGYVGGSGASGLTDGEFHLYLKYLPSDN